MSAAVNKLGTSLTSSSSLSAFLCSLSTSLFPLVYCSQPSPRTMLLTDQEYGPIVQPIFISVDPARDSTSQVARYVREFHPRLIGLTGSYATLKATCKAYRVYFSTPPDAKADDDYLVDHSIFFYFMDPNGQFVDAFGKASSEEDVIARVQKEIGRWERETGHKV